MSQSFESSPETVGAVLESKNVEENRGPRLWPLVVVLGVLLWIFTMTGGRQIFVNEMLSEAFDSHAEHLLRGDAGVDGQAIRHEVMLVNGQSHMYFGPFPALVRIPLNYLYPSGRGHWSRITGFCAGMIAVASFAGLVSLALRSSQMSPRWRSWVGNICLVGFAFGSPLLLLLGNLSIYGEAIIWALAWSVAALYFAFRSREAEGAALTRSLLAFSLCAAAALLARVTFGAPLLLITPLLALRLFRKGQIKNFAALFLPLGAALLFHLMLAHAKFGTYSGMNLNYSINPVQREFAQKYGIFQIQRMPYSFADYFFLRTPQLQSTPPYIRIHSGQWGAGREAYNHPTLFVMPFTETYTSLLWTSPWLILGAMVGLAWLFLPKGSSGFERAFAAGLFFQVICILAYMGLCQRYVAEFFPFLIFAFVVFLAKGKAAFRLRYVLIALVVVSVVINSFTTMSWLLEADMNVPAETKTKWMQFLSRSSRP